MTATDELRAMLDERGVEWRKAPHYSSDSVDNETVFCSECIEWLAHDHLNGKLGLKTLRYEITPAQVIAATLGEGKAKAHPWGYERDTGFFDMTRCECGELNDISARYCNQCGREIQIDMSVIEYAEDWYTPQHTCRVNADGTLTSLRDGKTYIDVATLGDNDAINDALIQIADWHHDHLSEHAEECEIDEYGGLYWVIGRDVSDDLDNLIIKAQNLAATLGADEYAIEHNVDGSYKCPKCGCVVDYDVRGDDERVITMDDYVIPFNFCPKCGARTEEDE